MHTLRRIFMPKQHPGVELISWATATRWVGWGFVEYLIPLFLFSFTSSYAETGLLRSTYSIMFMLALPLIGAIANHVRAKYIIIAGLCIYPFISLSYFLAGAFGIVAFIVIARGLNGISYALDSIGRSTYFMRHVAKDAAGKAFGYFETLTSFWWILSVLGSLVVINFFEIHELFLFIIPTTLIAIALVLKIPKDSLDTTEHAWKHHLSLASYTTLIHEVVLWNGRLRWLAFVSFFTGIIFTVTDFFLPIYLYAEGVSIEKIIIFMMVYSLPGLFGTPLGVWVDRIGKQAIPVAFAAIIFLVAGLALAEAYAVQLVLVFLLSFVGLVLDVAIQAEMTKLGNPKRYGTMTSAFSEIGQLSSIVGPIVLGFVIDAYSLQTALWILAGVSMLILFARLTTLKNSVQ